jgi:tRNA pseudouridine38-40 synthase
MPSSLYHALLRIEYDGTNYVGWARQPGEASVEGAILEAFAKIDARDVVVRCAGRTDAGVHASAQIVDVVYVASVPSENLGKALNTWLPDDVAIIASTTAPAGFDARGDATSRCYEYRVLTRPIHSPLRAHRTFHHPVELDEEILQQAATMLLGTHDFRAFTPSKTLHKHFEKTLIESVWRRDGDELVYRIRGNAFLRNMVRIIVGSMLAAGRRQTSLEEFAALLDGAPRSAAQATAPPQGLCLVDVTYQPIPGLPLSPRWLEKHGVEATIFGE